MDVMDSHGAASAAEWWLKKEVAHEHEDIAEVFR